MSYPTDRVILFDRSMNPLPELAPHEVFSRVRSEEINGEHSLTITTTRRLEEGWRLLTVDGTGKWREWVVTEPDEEHSSGKNALGTYHCVWSLQYDLTYSYAHAKSEVGIAHDTPAIEAAGYVLEGVNGWSVGACDAADIQQGKGCVFIYESAWSKLSKLVENTSCEVEAEIEVSNVFGVVSRKLLLLAHVGTETAYRRFDWGHDLTSIKRTPDPGPYYCRVVPLGKGETEYADDDETTFEWPLDITEETGTEENPGPYWIQDDEAAEVFKISDGQGGWIYPTKVVDYGEDDPELLLNAAMEDLHNHTRPGVTYEASVMQFEQAGMNVHGVALGDEVQCVDLGFNPDAALRVQGRITKIEMDELSPEATTQITIGQLRDNMANYLNTMEQSLSALDANTSRVREQLAALTTARYIKDLLSRINTEIAATGGYTYLVEGEGVITYDAAVSDPTVGSEATQIVQIKGGSVRIANSKKTGFSGIDDWDWKTVFTSGHILSELVTAVAITSGYIGNVDSSNYWNLDTGELVLQQLYRYRRTAVVDTDMLQTKHGQILGGDYYYLFHGVPPVIVDSRSGCDVHGLTVDSYAKIAGNGLNIGDLGGRIAIVPVSGRYSPEGYMPNITWSSIASNGNLRIISNYPSHASNEQLSMLKLHKGYACLCLYKETDSTATRTYSTGKGDYGFYVSSTEMSMNGGGGTIECSDNTINLKADEVKIKGATFKNVENSTVTGLDVYRVFASSLECYRYDGTGPINSTGSIDVGSTNTGYHYIRGILNVETLRVTNGNKSRVVTTKNYNKRALYAYETPAPYFGDIGSGTIGDDGLAYISIDDIFSETARTNINYRVFLQKCGAGDLWVSEKNSSYFVVSGTPGLVFDWEVKAQQTGFENTRLEDIDKEDMQNKSYKESGEAEDAVTAKYDEDYNFANSRQEELEPLYNDYVSQMESIYDEELSA